MRILKYLRLNQRIRLSMQLFLTAFFVISFSPIYADQNTTRDDDIQQLKTLVNKIDKDYSEKDQDRVYLSNETVKTQAPIELLKNYTRQLINILNTFGVSHPRNFIPNLRWLSVTDMTLPKKTLVNAGLPGQNINICRASFIGITTRESAIYPGQLTTAGCRISYAGYAFIITKFDVLAGIDNGLHWIPIKDVRNTASQKKSDITPDATRLIAAGYLQPNLPFNYTIEVNGAEPIEGGYGGINPVLICRAKNNDAIVIGKVVFFIGDNGKTQDACDIGVNNKELVIQNSYEILFWKKENQSL